MKNPFKVDKPSYEDLSMYQAYEKAREDAIKEIEKVKNDGSDFELARQKFLAVLKIRQ